MMVSAVHNVCKKGYYICIISTMVETNNPEQEIQPAYDLIGPIKEKFLTISNMFVPKEKSQDGVFISTSFDPTSHFENETEDVLQLYKQITGKDVDLENIPEDETDQ